MKSNGYKYQDESNKSGEINYRKGVAAVEEKNPDQLISLMKQRMEETVNIFQRLNENVFGTRHSPANIIGIGS